MIRFTITGTKADMGTVIAAARRVFDRNRPVDVTEDIAGNVTVSGFVSPSLKYVDRREAKFKRFQKRVQRIGGCAVLAEKIGVDPATVKQYMSRKAAPDLHMITRIAEATAWSVNECTQLFAEEKPRS